MNLEDHIKSLTPDLQEKARACGSVQELLALAKEEGVPVPEEALAAIAGGADSESDGCKPPVPPCPKCGSDNTFFNGYCCQCNNCGWMWR